MILREMPEKIGEEKSMGKTEGNGKERRRAGEIRNGLFATAEFRIVVSCSRFVCHFIYFRIIAVVCKWVCMCMCLCVSVYR